MATPLLFISWLLLINFFNTIPSVSCDGSLLQRINNYRNMNLHSLQHDGLTRWFLEYKPNSYQKNNPVVIVLHGAVSSMYNMYGKAAEGNSLHWLKLSNQNGFLVLTPNGTNKRNTFGKYQYWNDINDGITKADDVGFIVSLLQWAIRERQIDPTRVYLTGASNGGMMIYRLLVEKSEFFTAAGVLIANMPERTIPEPKYPRPIMIMDGTKDPIIPWNGGQLTRRLSIFGKCRSALDTRDYWIQSNKANSTTSSEYLLPDYNPKDSCRIQVNYYNPLNNSGTSSLSAPVLFYTMIGGGHWYAEQTKSTDFPTLAEQQYGPVCYDASAVQLIWDFVSQFVMPSK